MDGVLIVGAGAIGKVLAWTFVSRGMEESKVHLFVREKRAEALKQSAAGKLYSISQKKIVTASYSKMKIVSKPDDLRGSAIKVIIVAIPANVFSSEEGI